MTEAQASILVVDDDPINRMLLSRDLEREGHRVTTAEDGGSALEALHTEPFDLVLLDVLMPRLDGYETLAQIERDEAAPRSRDHGLGARGHREAAATFAVTAAGRPVVSDVRVEYPEGEQRLQAAGGDVPAFSSLRRAIFDARPDGGETAVVGELKIWAHRVTPDHDSEGVPAQLEVHIGDEIRVFELELSGGQIVLPLTQPSWRVVITPATGVEHGSVSSGDACDRAAR